MQIKSQITFDDTSVAFGAKPDKALKKANFIFTVINNPTISAVGTKLVKLALSARLPIKGVIKHTVFEQFCGGENIEQTTKTIEGMAEYHVGGILDYSVEGEKNEKSFNATRDEILKTIDRASTAPNIPFCVFKLTGVGYFSVLQKKQEKKDFSPKELEAFNRLKQRVKDICQRAYDKDMPILIDAEETWIQDAIDEIVYEMMELYNKEKAIVYNTFQMYRSDMLANLKKAFHYAAMNNYYLGAKLVRGAYMEKERERAKEKGYPSPIQPNKEATDADFNKGLEYCLDNKQRIYLLCGSHNENSNYYLTILMEKHGLKNNDSRIYFSQLFGMSDNISYNLAKGGYNVVKYVPYGPVRSVMPYLFRRASENTSVAGQSSRELTLIRKEIKRRRL